MLFTMVEVLPILLRLCLSDLLSGIRSRKIGRLLNVLDVLIMIDCERLDHDSPRKHIR